SDGLQPDPTADLALLALLIRAEPAAIAVRGGIWEAPLEWRHLPALGELVRAARPERAALGQREQRRRRAADLRQPLRARPVEPGQRTQEAPGVGVLGVVEDLVQR